MTALALSNAQARRAFLAVHALTHDPDAPPGSTLDLIRTLGFVQIDSIRTIARAHQHILWTRDHAHEDEVLRLLHAEHRALFEHWTHDASLIPVEFYPYWRRRFADRRARLRDSAWMKERLGSARILKAVLRRIEAEGPLRARDFEDSGRTGPWWGWSRSKAALEFLWHAGDLAIPRRDGFEKVYDLAGRVIPADLRERRASRAEIVDWACGAALERLGFATPAELARFWALVGIDEAHAWVARNRKRLAPIRVEGADGKSVAAVARPDIETVASGPPAPERMRAINPFDPTIRDRARLRRLFGFDYTIEIFVPAPKRKHGYYVYPLLEGERFVGRLDAKADREGDRLIVQGLWLEPGVAADARRLQALDAELARLARFGGVSAVEWTTARPRPARRAA